MPAEEPATKTAKILYRPWGMVGGLVAGAIAGQVTTQVWKRVSPTRTDDPPKPLQSEYSVKEVLAAAAVQGAIFYVVKALIQRGTARGFQRWSGEWPGD